MQSRIVDIAKKSNEWMRSIEANIVRVVEDNQQATLDYNRRQLLGSKDALGNPLRHKRTGKTTLSKAYARRKGKTRPNLFDTGEFQDKMLLTMPSKEEYFITSKDHKTGWLAGAYGDIFGVSEQNQPKAQKTNDKLVIEDYLNKVFR